MPDDSSPQQPEDEQPVPQADEAQETVADASPSESGSFEAPYPGSKAMPQWNTGPLIDAPKFTWKKWAKMLGPGRVLGGAAIGGGEWLVGPKVTAQYGGALLWLGTFSILAQVLYNIEISRYTLYSGEPIFNGKFRMYPGPTFWLAAYLLLDFGSIFPYLAAQAAAPLFTAIYGLVPIPEDPDAIVSMIGMTFTHKLTLRIFAYMIFLTALIPLIFGGKILSALKVVMGFKIITVMGFLLVLAFINPNWGTWKEIFTGFVKVGTVPIRRGEDLNGNGVLDEGEDWDNDQVLDVDEPLIPLKINSLDDLTTTIDINEDGTADPILVAYIARKGRLPDMDSWRRADPDGNFLTAEQKQKIADATLSLGGSFLWRLDIDEDGRPDTHVTLPGMENRVGILYNRKGEPYLDIDGDFTRDGDNVDNFIIAFFTGRPFPEIDWSLIAFLSALVAISGSGGLSNAPISNYTRDEGWGMGHHVGAIPSVVGGVKLQLSHVGTVFDPTEEAMPRWRRWYKHVRRDQLFVWLPACFFGLALPSMLSVEYLPRGFETQDDWTAAVMTADGVASHFGEEENEKGIEQTSKRLKLTQDPEETTRLRNRRDALVRKRGRSAAIFWFLTVFCGFLVLAPSMSTSADGIVRRWVDVFWTSSGKLRKLDPSTIRYVYFGVLAIYAVFGMIMLGVAKPDKLLTIATTIYNFALGFSCWHTLAVNSFLLPPKLRPHMLIRLGLFLAGAFFLFIAVVSSMQKLGYI
ncbi:MAG: Nramp family divalent metal transporter [Pirellulaceae bacterium]